MVSPFSSHQRKKYVLFAFGQFKKNDPVHFEALDPSETFQIFISPRANQLGVKM